MASILQTPFLKFYYSLLVENVLVLVQTFCTSDTQVYSCTYASLGLNELKTIKLMKRFWYEEKIWGLFMWADSKCNVDYIMRIS